MARQWLTKLRKERGLSQAALAKLVRLSPSEISRIECGYRDVAGAEANAICRELGCTLAHFGIKPEPAPPPKGLAASERSPATNGVAHTQPLIAEAATAPSVAPRPDLDREPDLSAPGSFAELPLPEWLEKPEPATNEFYGRRA